MSVSNTARKWAAAAALGAGLCGANAAHAGIPVIDVSVLTQAIQNVIAWGQQYGQMTQQYQQLVQQYDQLVLQYNAATGTRNLGNILNNPALQQAVPGGTQLMATYSSINANGYAGLSSAAQALRNASMLYDCARRAGEDLRLCQAASVTNSQNQANYEAALDLMSQRTAQIQALQNAINSTSDPKAIGELQARIASENAQIVNDANRIALMQAMAESQDRLVQQQYRERELRSLSSTGSTLDTFVFTPR
jgi:type IV secretion system protein VirB5